MKSFKGFLNNSVRLASGRVASGEMSEEAFKVYRARAERLREREDYLKRRFKVRATRARQERSLRRLCAAVEGNGVIASFDTEFPYSNGRAPVDQLGISVWDGGVTTTTTYVLASRAKHYGKVRCTHGPTIIVQEREEMREIARETYARADLNVFHTASVEFEKLDIHPDSGRFVDIASLGFLIDPVHRMGLKTLCSHFGIMLIGHHNAGNDALATLRVALKMAGEIDPDRLDEVSEEDEEMHRMLMLPTRQELPGGVGFSSLRREVRREVEHQNSTLAQIDL